MNPDSLPDHTDSPGLQADEPLAGPARSAPSRSRAKQWVAAAAVAGALLGTTGVAMAQTDDSSSTSADSAATSEAPAGVADGTMTPPDPMDRSQAVHPGEELLTGDTAEQVKAAAEAAVPDGTVDRVETDAEGSAYEAHMTKSDGTHVTVEVDESFGVTTVETDPTGPPSGLPGPPSGQAPAPSSDSPSADATA